MNDNPYAAPATSITDAAAADAGERVRYCTFWPRVLASVIDNVLLAAVTVPLCLAVYGLAYFESSKHIEGPADVGINYLLPAVVIIGFWLWVGGTPGKLWLGIRVVDGRTHGRLGFGQALIRYVGYIPSTLALFLGFLSMLWHPRRQCWHDLMAGTIVIRTKGGLPPVRTPGRRPARRGQVAPPKPPQERSP